MPDTDVKNIITFITSSKSVYKQVITDTIECMHTVLEDTLYSEYGDSWFVELKKFAAKSLNSAEKIYSCDLKMLFLAFLESDELVNKLFKNNLDEKQGFLNCVKVVLDDIENLTDENVPDINDTKWEDGITHLKTTVNFFPFARDRLGETFISKVAVHFSKLKKFDRYMPTYSIQKTIEDEELQISVGEFVEHCVIQEATVVTQDKTLCFCTKSYNDFLNGVKTYIEFLAKAKEKKKRRILWMKIAVIAMAVILIFISAYTSNRITRVVLKNDKSPTPSETVSLDSSDLNVSSANNESSEPDVSSTDLVSSDTSSIDSIVVSEPESSNSETATTVDGNGRVTDVSTAKYRYEDGGSFYGDYNEYSTTVKDAGVVYIEPYKCYLTNDEPSIRINIKNKTDNMIKNISYEIIFYDDAGNKILSYSETKVMQNSATVSITENQSHYCSVVIPAGNLYNKNADLGFTKVYSKVSYDTVQ